MLNIFYGRECINKDKFIFKSLNKENQTIILVPDQFTLQAERNAFKYLEVSSLMNIEILSPSRMGLRVLKEVGKHKKGRIGRYGCHMLLSRIVREEKENLKVFAGMDGKSSFIDLAKNLIADMKQYNTSQEGLKEIIESLEEDSMLRRKLSDMSLIYDRYEAELSERFLDPEDLLNEVINAVKESEWIGKSDIWVTGFNTFTPKNLKLMEELMKSASNLNIVMTGDFSSADNEVFEIAGISVKLLEKIAEGCQTEYRTMQIDDEDCKIKDKPEDLGLIESDLYVYPGRKYEGKSENITFVQAGNPYGEIETAAAYVLSLVKSGKYRYKDIAIICNDLDNRGSIIRRVFGEYGMKPFIDNKRGIIHNPVAALNLYLLQAASGVLNEETIIGFMKTGLSGFQEDEIERLENFAYKYKIKGGMWKRPFTRGSKDFSEEEFAELENTRKTLIGFFEKFMTKFQKAKLARDKIKTLYFFLRDDLMLPEKLEKLIQSYEEQGNLEIAFEMAQIWKAVLEVYEQVVMVIGDEEADAEEILDLISIGFESVEMGVLPATADEILVGNIQRTRTGEIKALVVIGANDGILPSSPAGAGILSEREKTILHEKNFDITKLDRTRAMEEKLGIYRMLSSPREKLFISYSISDTEGKATKPAMVFSKLKGMFPENEVEKDILSSNNLEKMALAPKSGLTHLTEKLRRWENGEKTTEREDLYRRSLLIWYAENEKQALARVERGLLYTFMEAGLSAEEAERLYKNDRNRDFVLSPSRIEKYGRCAFSHFINYGLKPEEKRVYEIAGREMGDIYHLCLMKLSDYLTEPGVPITNPQSKWMNISKEECLAFVEEFIENEGSEYNDGLLQEDNEAKYRADRMKTVCADAAQMLINHVQKGRIQEIFFEAEFGRNSSKKFPAIEIDTAAGKVLIEGKIDRVDVLPNDYIKIIDYKSGSEAFNIQEAKAGWRLQLMLYLKAAMGDFKREGKPAGVFYFKLAEPQTDGGSLSGAELQYYIEKEVKKEFRLDGIVVNDPEVLECIAGKDDLSEVMATGRIKKDSAEPFENDRILSKESFDELREIVDEKLSELCSDLVSGKVGANPGKVKDDTACKFCSYKSICKFDIAFRGCTYRKIR